MTLNMPLDAGEYSVHFGLSPNRIGKHSDRPR